MLTVSGVPFLVGGAYAFHHYTGIKRNTKDLDIFIRRDDFQRLSEALSQAGYQTELTYPHWLGKLFFNGDFIDIIFSSGNGIAEVDEAWFEYAAKASIFNVEADICPVEEMIWSKAFIMERERYDGADVAHLLRACGDRLDWQRLLDRFDSCWRILLSHFALFGFIYPGDRELIPAWIIGELLGRLREETRTPPPDHGTCFGTVLSREQYLPDIEQWGYRDGRLVPLGKMTERDAASWTDAIKNKQ